MPFFASLTLDNEIIHSKVLIIPIFMRDNNIRYGYRPIPSEIDTAELELLREALVQMGNDVHLLDKWYRKDSNKVILSSLFIVKCCSP